MQDERVKRYLRNPLLVDLPPHPLAHRGDHPRRHQVPELALGGKPGVAVDHHIDIGGGVLKAAEERARAPERACREGEVGEEPPHPDASRRHMPDLLFRLVDPDHVAVGHPVDRIQVFGFMLPNPGEGFGKIVFPVPPAREVCSLTGRLRDVTEDAPDAVAVVVVRDRVDAAVPVLDEVTESYRLHRSVLRNASTASHSAPFRRIRRVVRSTTVLGVPGSSPPSTT